MIDRKAVMHRIDHSTPLEETNSNYGFNLPWWDSLLGTYRGVPAQGHDRMPLGLAEFRYERDANRVPAVLAMSFVSPEDRRGQAKPTAPGHAATVTIGHAAMQERQKNEIAL